MNSIRRMSPEAQEGKPSGDWASSLVKWFQENARNLPWRKTQDPYRVWISEIMLQQTRIEVVIPYYDRFMERFPTVEALAEAPIEDVLKLWEGLGYYSRARNLHAAAQKVASMGGFPNTKETLKKLPGIGDYTGGAIAAIAFHEPVTAVDGNVLRVMARLLCFSDNVLEDATKKWVTAYLQGLYADGESGESDTKAAFRLRDHAGAFVQGLMELGETVCLPGAPQCEQCPLASYCLAKQESRQLDLPVREKKQSKKTEDRLVLMIQNESGKVLLFRRPDQGILAGLKELPNVLLPKGMYDALPTKVQDDHHQNEDGLSDSIQAMFLEQYGISVKLGQWLKEDKHVFTHRTWNMKVFNGTLVGSEGEGFFADPAEVMLPTAFKKLLS